MYGYLPQDNNFQSLGSIKDYRFESQESVTGHPYNERADSPRAFQSTRILSRKPTEINSASGSIASQSHQQHSPGSITRQSTQDSLFDSQGNGLFNSKVETSSSSERDCSSTSSRVKNPRASPSHELSAASLSLYPAASAFSSRLLFNASSSSSSPRLRRSSPQFKATNAPTKTNATHTRLPLKKHTTKAVAREAKTQKKGLGKGRSISPRVSPKPKPTTRRNSKEEPEDGRLHPEDPLRSGSIPAQSANSSRQQLDEGEVGTMLVPSPTHETHPRMSYSDGPIHGSLNSPPTSSGSARPRKKKNLSAKLRVATLTAGKQTATASSKANLLGKGRARARDSSDSDSDSETGGFGLARGRAKGSRRNTRDSEGYAPTSSDDPGSSDDEAQLIGQRRGRLRSRADGRGKSSVTKIPRTMPHSNHHPSLVSPAHQTPRASTVPRSTPEASGSALTESLSSEKRTIKTKKVRATRGDGPAPVRKRSTGRPKGRKQGLFPCRAPPPSKPCGRRFSRESDLQRHYETSKEHRHDLFPSLPDHACEMCDSPYGGRFDALRRHWYESKAGAQCVRALIEKYGSIWEEYVERHSSRWKEALEKATTAGS
ncbi:hypothetical protein V5O48_011992 [Marasmius crinis-equi]|uniref:C2H2-type domain-containing protein n=1 Tax=Marasmius crinis-equi TaxID=585013 RepID=A0ABR3F438_9AGAR